VIALGRRNGQPLRIGHRGAPALAPENTIRSFRAALEAGVDLIEFDVLALRGGELVVAHSDDLHEVSHGAARGTVIDRPLASLRESCPELPTLDEALEFFASEATEAGLHLDLKTLGREEAVAAALGRFRVSERSLVSSFFVRSVRRIVGLDPRVRPGITFPHSVLGITESGRSAPIARIGLEAARRAMPVLAAPLLSISGAHALVLHHSVVDERAVRSARRRGAPVVAWTVDRPDDLARVDRAGVDAVVTNDPRLFASTLGA